MSKQSIKVFGFWTAVSLVLGNMIGSGIFFLPASLAHIGPISILGWVVTAVGAISLAYIFSLLSLHNPCSGGPFTHTREAFGDAMGFFMAWGYWIMNWTSNAAISLAFVSYLSYFFPAIADHALYSFLGGTALIWITTAINCVNLRYGGRVQVITVIIKLFPLLLVSVVGVFYIDVNNYLPFNPNYETSLEGISAAAALTMWAFIGLEAATVPADNVKDAGKTISRATLLGTSLGAGIYILITAIVFGLIPATTLSQSHAPFVDVVSKIFGPWMAPVIGFCVLTSIFGGLNGWILLQGQIPCALAKQGLFPKIFAKTSKANAPIFGLVFSSVLTTLILLLNSDQTLVHQFNNMILIGTIMTMGTYLASALAAVKIFKGARKKITAGFMMAVLMGVSYVLWAIYGVGMDKLLICLAVYACGIPVYFYSKYEHQRTIKIVTDIV